MKLVMATRNRHKLEELRAIFNLPGLEVVSALDFPNIPEVIEDGDTFQANAIKKATPLARATGLWALADDTGLEVEALAGRPGVFSARYAGEPVSYPRNNEKLLRELAGCADRRARFRCVVALADPRGHAETVEGICAGVITDAPRGNQGFGYDPIFMPHGFRLTFAEMDAELKNRISHRALALTAAKQAWAGKLTAGAQTLPLEG